MLLQTLKMSETDTLLQEGWDGNGWYVSWSQNIRLNKSDDKEMFARLTTKACRLEDWVHVRIYEEINLICMQATLKETENPLRSLEKLNITVKIGI